jgi:uncharacterized protein YuzB (UPF0349 family)
LSRFLATLLATILSKLSSKRFSEANEHCEELTVLILIKVAYLSATLPLLVAKNIQMNLDFDFNALRDSAMDRGIAKEGLQQQLDAVKHGVSKKVESAPFLDIKTITYGSAANVKTVAIDNDTDLVLVEYKWYSMCTVCVSDLMPSIDILHGETNIIIYTKYLHLFAMEPEEFVDNLNACYKNPIISKHYVEGDKLYAICKGQLYGVASKVVRKTDLECPPGSWEIKKYKDSYYTQFRGDKYQSLYQVCDAVLSSDFSVTANNSSIFDAMMFYHAYVPNYELLPFLAIIAFSQPEEFSDFGNMSADSPLKRTVIRDQADAIIRNYEKGLVDNLTSKESCLIVGKNIS